MGIEWVGVFPSSPPFTQHVSVLLSKTSTVRHAAVLTSVFESPGWQAVIEEERTKLELKNGRYIYCIERDGLLCLVAVISADSSRGEGTSDSHSIFSATSSSTPRFMTALKSAVRDAGGHDSNGDATAARQLKRNLKPATLTELAKRLSNAETFDKVAATARKVNDLKVTMHATLLKATEREYLIETLDEKAKDLRTSANEMFEGSKSIRRSLCRRYACCFAGVTFTILLLITIIVVCLNYYQFNWW